MELTEEHAIITFGNPEGTLGRWEKNSFYERQFNWFHLCQLGFKSGPVVSRYVSADAAELVKQHLMMENNNLAINLLDTSSAQQEAFVTCAIELKDLDPNITKDMLENLFKHERKSVGGDITGLEYDAENRMAVITFETPEGQ